jgi:molybdenum cofactor synthesis domain-containing protein
MARLPHNNRFKTTVITLSDRASRGEYPDESGKTAIDLLEDYFASQNWPCTFSHLIIPDDAERLAAEISNLNDSHCDLLVTSGGTGIGPRDITVDTIRPMLSKEIPGVMEMIRIKYGSEKPAALLSRAVAGTIGQTLVFTLPGSPRAVKEYLSEIIPGLAHMFFMLHGVDKHGK